MWTDFERQTNFEAEVQALAMLTLASAARNWSDAMPLTGFAFNCWSADGGLGISVSSHPRARELDPPDWEYKCAETELADVKQSD